MENIQNSTPIVNEPKISPISSPSNNGFMSSRRNILIVTGVLTVIVGLVLYFVLMSPAPTQTPITENNNNLPDLNPGARNIQVYTEGNDQNNEGEFSEAEYPDLVHIWPKEILSYNVSSEIVEKMFINGEGKEVKNKEKEIYIYFQDKESGAVYRATSPYYNVEKITNTTITGIKKSVFSSDNKYLSFIDSKNNRYYLS